MLFQPCCLDIKRTEIHQKSLSTIFQASWGKENVWELCSHVARHGSIVRNQTTLRSLSIQGSQKTVSRHKGFRRFCSHTLHLRARSILALFYVTDIPGPVIIGLPASTELILLQFNWVRQTRHPHTSSYGCLKDKASKQDRETILIRDEQDLITQ